MLWCASARLTGKAFVLWCLLYRVYAVHCNCFRNIPLMRLDLWMAVHIGHQPYHQVILPQVDHIAKLEGDKAAVQQRHREVDERIKALREEAATAAAAKRAAGVTRRCRHVLLLWIILHTYVVCHSVCIIAARIYLH